MNIRQIEQESPGNYYYDVRDQLKRHIYGRSEQAFAAGDAARDAIRTSRQLAQRQQAVRRFFINCLGGLPTGNTKLNARTVGTVRGRGFRIEKVIFESRPKHFVTANLYLPEKTRCRTGAVLFLCGHYEQAKHVPEYQAVCQMLVRTGLVVLAQDPIGQGERFSYYESRLGRTTVKWGINEHDYAGCQCLLLGDTIARYFLHDAMRGFDYLRSRPEVDPARIGVTGNSGGGTQTCMMMLADPRIAAAAPATFIMNRRTYMLAGGAQDAEQIWPGFTAAGFDHEDILLAMAPKPVRVLAVTYDFFPIEGTRRTVERCRRIWRFCGRESDLDLVEDQSIHKYTPKLARSAAEFFARHLLGTRLGARPLAVSLFEPSKLWCTRSGQVRGEIPGARFVPEANRERLAEIESGLAKIPVRPRRKQEKTWLRQQVFNHRKPCPLNPRFAWGKPVHWKELTVEYCMWWSQEGISSFAKLFRLNSLRERRLPVTLAVWDKGSTAIRKHLAWLRAECRRGRAVMVLDVSGVGVLAPNTITPVPQWEFYGVIHKFADDLVWLDDSLPALRTYDVVRALDMISKWPWLDPRGIRGYGHGKHGVYLLLAAALDKRLERVRVVQGIGSYASFVTQRHYEPADIKSVVFPGILKHFDLPRV